MSITDEIQEITTDYVKKKLDGIRFLWNTPETKHYLLLIITLVVSLFAFYSIMTFLIMSFGLLRAIALIIIVGNFVFFGLFMYIMIDLILFLETARKNQDTPEKIKFLKLKYVSSEGYDKIKRYRLIFLISIIIALTIGFVVMWILSNMSYEMIFLMGSIGFGIIIAIWILGLLLIGVLAFTATKGTMEAYEEKHSKSFEKRPILFFLLLPIPWILFLIVVSFTTSLAEINLGDIFVTILELHFIFLFLGIIGVIALMKKNLRLGYSLSFVSALVVVIFVIVIPFIIGTIINLMGTILAFIITTFLFIQGILDKNGDDLRDYYAAWDKKLEKFNILSHRDLLNRIFDIDFKSDHLIIENPNIFRNFILGLMILTITSYSFISIIGNEFAISIEQGMESLDDFSMIISGIEDTAIILAMVIVMIAIMRRQARKDYTEKIKPTKIAYQPQPTPVSPPQKQTGVISCPNCYNNVAPRKFCTKCGARMSIQCPIVTK